MFKGEKFTPEEFYTAEIASGVMEKAEKILFELARKIQT